MTHANDNGTSSGGRTPFVVQTADELVNMSIRLKMSVSELLKTGTVVLAGRSGEEACELEAIEVGADLKASLSAAGENDTVA